jgi:hypothetical protein
MTGEDWDLEISCTSRSYCYNPFTPKRLIDYPEVEFEASLDTILNQIAQLYPDLERKKMSYEPCRSTMRYPPQLIQHESDSDDIEISDEYEYSSSSSSDEMDSSDSSSE